MRIYKLFLLTALVTLSWGSTVLAQRPTNLSARLASLDQHLDYARAVVTPFKDSRALELLQKAFAQRDQAKSAAGLMRWDEAVSHIELSTSLADQAIKLTLDGPVARFRTRLDETISRAESIVVGSGSFQAERILQRAIENRKLAIGFAQARDISKAIEHYQVAQKLALQAIQLAGPTAGTPRNAAEAAQQQYEELRARAREAVERSRNSGAAKPYEEALKRGQVAKQSYAKGYLEVAAQNYNQAIRLFNRAIELATPRPSPAAMGLDSELANLGDLIRSARERVEQSDRVRARIFLDRAQELYLEADAAKERGEPARARWKIIVARNLVTRALRTSVQSPQMLSERLSPQIQSLRDDARRLQDQAAESGSEEALTLSTLAANAASRAELMLRRGYTRSALEAVLFGNRFLFAAERLLRKEDQEQASGEDLGRRLKELEKAIDATETRLGAGEPDWRRSLLEQAKEAHDRAADAIQRDQRIVARVSLAAGFEALRTIARTFDGG